MKNFIGLLTVSFLIYFSANAQDKKILIYIGSSGQYPTQSELALQLYQESNPISFQVTSQELFCGAVTETISSFDVVIFDGTSNIQDCNWIDVINQLDYFMREAGGEVIFMPNSILDDEGNITVDQYNTQSNINFILSEGNVGGVSWFEGITVTDYIDVPPFPQHGISMYNSNCGIDLFFYNSPYDAFQGEGVGIFQSVYDYPSGDIGSCETMFYTPMWYEISQTDLDDDNFFSIFEFGGDAVTQYYNFPNLLNVDNIQIAFGKQIGNGNVIFFGDAEPAWNNGSPNYNGAINLLGNIITLNVDGFQMGCIDETAYNYSEDADMDDGSCYSIILGCTDSIAYNFVTPTGDNLIDINTDDGSCMSYEEFLIDSLQLALAVFETVEEAQDYSLSLDGDDDYIRIEHNEMFNLLNNMTVMAWVKLSENQNDHNTIIAKRDDSIHPNGNHPWQLTTSIEYPQNQAMFCSSKNNSYTYSYSITPIFDYYQWVNIASVVEGDSVKLYKNGIYISTAYFPVSNRTENNFDILIGSVGRSNAEYFMGELDDILLFDIALSDNEVQSFISCPPSGNEDGLVGYWNFNEGSGDTVYDISGNGNHGIIYGGAEFSEDVPESYNGCTDANALNFDESALCDNGSCVFADDVLSNLEESFNQTVSTLNNDLDSTNSTLNEVIDTWQSSIDLTNATLDEVSDMNQTIASFTTLIDLQEGWNMIGYGCPESVNIEQGMSMYTDLVLLIKDNNGSVYLPEFNFNGIGDFTPGYGYQLKVSESIEDFGLCGDYTNTESPEITDIETDNAQMQNDINCLTGNPQIGDHCYGGIVFYVEEGEQGKYGLVATTEIVGTGTYYDAIELSDNYEYEGYDDWRLPSLDELYIIYSQIYSSGLISYITGDIYNWYWALNECEDTTSPAASDIHFTDGFIAECNNADSNPGGIIAIRSFGNVNYGCMDSLACNFTPEANMANGSCEYAQLGYDCDGNITAQIGEVMEGGYLFYIDSTGKHGLVAASEDLIAVNWGCNGVDLLGADSQTIGSGYQNSLDIVAGCIETPIAASEALFYESEGFTDWFLPSIDELVEVYNMISQNSSIGNIGLFTEDWYMSSSESGPNSYYDIHFGNSSGGIAASAGKIIPSNPRWIRPIRAF